MALSPESSTYTYCATGPRHLQRADLAALQRLTGGFWCLAAQSPKPVWPFHNCQQIRMEWL